MSLNLAVEQTTKQVTRKLVTPCKAILKFVDFTNLVESKIIEREITVDLT